MDDRARKAAEEIHRKRQKCEYTYCPKGVMCEGEIRLLVEIISRHFAEPAPEPAGFGTRWGSGDPADLAPDTEHGCDSEELGKRAEVFFEPAPPEAEPEAGAREAQRWLDDHWQEYEFTKKWSTRYKMNVPDQESLPTLLAAYAAREHRERERALKHDWYMRGHKDGRAYAEEDAREREERLRSTMRSFVEEVEAVLNGELGSEWADHYGPLWDKLAAIRREVEPK